MTFGELIFKLVEWLTEFWPIHRVNQWEQGVLVRAGTVVKTCTHTNGLRGTGFHLILPFYFELLVEETNIDATIFPRIDFTTSDGVLVSAVFGVQYEIVNAGLMYQHIHDYDDTVETAIMTELAETGMRLPQKKLLDCMCRDAQHRCLEVLPKWGVKVRHIGIASMTDSTTLRLIVGGHPAPGALRFPCLRATRAPSGSLPTGRRTPPSNALSCALSKRFLEERPLSFAETQKGAHYVWRWRCWWPA